MHDTSQIPHKWNLYLIYFYRYLDPTKEKNIDPQG